MLASVATNFILAVLILIHLRKSLSGRYLFWIIFGLNGWVLSNYFSNLNLNYEISLWMNKLIFFTTAVASWGFASFARIFPEEQALGRRIGWLVDGSLLLIMLISISPFLVYDIVPKNGITEVTFGWGISIYGIFVLSCLFYTVFAIFKKYFSEKFIEYKNVLNLLVIGVGIFLVFAITTNLIVPFFFGNFNLTIFTPIYTTLFSCIIFWAILKHKFLNIKVIAVELITFSLWLFLFAQIVLSKDFTDKIVDIALLVLIVVFGVLLIRSIRKEVERKEELQLMADKLASANDQLRKLDNAKSEFISIASHQLRTPLTAIKGFVSLILEGTYGEINPKATTALNKVFASTESLVQLVEDLLNVSRIESGRMEFKLEKAEIEPVLQELYENFILIAKEKDLYLDFKLPKKALPKVMIDASKLREVISNLIDNALKYTEKGGVTVKAEAVMGDDSKTAKAVRVSISDTGIGIPESEMPYLFKKFSRGKDVNRLHVGGTGLGLYVGKSIMEGHHGRIWIESKGAGRGSKFILELPIN